MTSSLVNNAYVRLFNKTNRKNIHKASEELLSYQKWSKYSCRIFSFIVTITITIKLYIKRNSRS